MDPVPDPLLLRKSGSAGNRTRDSVSVARNSDRKLIVKPNNENFNDFYSTPNITEMIKEREETDGACGTCWREEKCLQDSRGHT